MVYDHAPVPSKTRVSMVDERRRDALFSSGVLPAALTLDGAPLDSARFLAENVNKELESRGLLVTTAIDDRGLPRVHLRTFDIVNSRETGFGVFVTHTFISADLETEAGNKRIAFFFKRGKVPVWAFDEVIEPVFNEPLSLAVKEFAAKLANALYGVRVSDDAVRGLMRKLDGARSATSFMDVYALGFTNNPMAVDKLVELIEDRDDYVRLAALSSLGNLGASDQLPLLKTIYETTGRIWQDRAMAIKAIGDIGNAEANAYIEAEAARLQKLPASSDVIWMRRVLGLYR